ncbi:hypothetical protein SAMN02745195_00344 [Thermoanaerobacter uzonensis DSM 18761]|jgi:cytochrome c-type biogenesis protein CcmE|uniref:Uncharacterized protein n=1 Tax=Thermoanaerobacter uzonensis DSM 18761 TaxID=1123369 RepID=A0A1M4TEX7_9THEO|nr:hypothetical protein SAMN02745195_00344 [Thermoanaerobacter uzonensis DSM 18761]
MSKKIIKIVLAVIMVIGAAFFSKLYAILQSIIFILRGTQ